MGVSVNLMFFLFANVYRCIMYICVCMHCMNDYVSFTILMLRYETLLDLDQALRSRGSQLIVLRGKPETVFPCVFRAWGVSRLVFELDTEPYARKRDQQMQELCKEYGVQMQSLLGHTLYDPAEVCRANRGQPPLRYNSFLDVA